MKKKVAKRAETESIGCYEKILPPSDGAQYEYLADIKAKHLYELLLVYKKGQLMSMTAFTKLSKCFTTLNKTRLELLFRRVVPNGNMDLDKFFVAVQHLAEELGCCGYEETVDQALNHFIK